MPNSNQQTDAQKIWSSWTPQQRNNFVKMAKAYKTADAVGGYAGASNRNDLNKFFGVRNTTNASR